MCAGGAYVTNKATLESLPDLVVFDGFASNIMLAGEKILVKQFETIFCIDTASFVTPSFVTKHRPYVYAVCPQLQKNISVKLLRAAYTLLSNVGGYRRVTTNYSYVNAVPGGGKTHSLVNDIKSTSDTCRVITANVGSAEDIRAHLGSSQTLVTTVDSALMHTDKSGPPTRLYVDEVFMMHQGVLLLVIQKLKPKSVFCYGDKSQIGYICRDPLFRPAHHHHSLHDGIVSDKLVSYRCPPDVCYILSKMRSAAGPAYPGDVLSAGERPLRTLSVEPVTDETHFNYEEVEAVLTFTQEDKNVMKKNLKNLANLVVMTVHEAQGKTFPRVAIVRLKKQDDSVFDSLPHRIVALSRHTHKCTYVVTQTKKNDMLAQDIALLDGITDLALTRHVVNQCV
jgi:hypothetical protein